MPSRPAKKLITYVALLRGINVGGNSLVSMAKLRECFSEIGFADVRTYINSGNVIFRSDEKNAAVLVRKIESKLKRALGLAIRVTIRSAAQMNALARKIPDEWTNDADMKTDVLFLWDEADRPGILGEIAANEEVDRLVYAKGAVIWSIDRAKYGKSKMNKIIGTFVYKNMTARNVNTVRKLCALMSDKQ